MSGDTIEIIIKNNGLEKMILYPKAFVASSDSAEYYNQIKGRSMVAWFKNEALDVVNVYGNGESLFFMRDDKTRNLIGLNTIICSDIVLRFEDRVLTDASFLVNPEGKFIPPHELKPEDIKLNGFVWRGEEKPDKSDFLKNELTKEELIERQEELKSLPLNLEKRKSSIKRPPLKRNFNQ